MRIMNMPKIFQSYPNQRIIKVHREKPTSDFLGIKNENWQAACRDLGAHSTMLYLYIASNADNYEFALSQRAVQQSIGMPRSTYYDQFHKLVDRGYLKQSNGSTYEFFEKPQPSDRIEDVNQEFSDGIDFTAAELPISSGGDVVLSEDIEINNNHSTNNEINIEKNSQKEELYPDVEVHIKAPKAKGKNRPEDKPSVWRF